LSGSELGINGYFEAFASVETTRRTETGEAEAKAKEGYGIKWVLISG
jgi:hypothetical protein